MYVITKRFIKSKRVFSYCTYTRLNYECKWKVNKNLLKIVMYIIRRSVFFSTANDIYLTKFSSLATRRTVESTAEKKITTNKLISPFRTLVIHSLSADHINWLVLFIFFVSNKSFICLLILKIHLIAYAHTKKRIRHAIASINRVEKTYTIE